MRANITVVLFSVLVQHGPRCHVLVAPGTGPVTVHRLHKVRIHRVPVCWCGCVSGRVYVCFAGGGRVAVSHPQRCSSSSSLLQAAFGSVRQAGTKPARTTVTAGHRGLSFQSTPSTLCQVNAHTPCQRQLQRLRRAQCLALPSKTPNPCTHANKAKPSNKDARCLHRRRCGASRCCVPLRGGLAAATGR